MSQTFFIADKHTQTGPFTLDEMEQLYLTRETIVWTEGFDNWTKAGEISLLKDIVRLAPPPIPVLEEEPIMEQEPPLSVPESKPVGKHFGYKLAKRRERLMGVIIESFLI